MLGTFTEKAISTGESRPRAWSGNSAGSNSENVSDQRRALMLPQELKELGQDREIIIVENSKPILCDKARYFADATFIDRLKAVSPTLKGLGKRLPTQLQLEDAAFMVGELSVPVTPIDFDLYQARMESRMRPLRADEEIDLKRMDERLLNLPRYANSDDPTISETEALVDAHLSTLGWMEQPLSSQSRSVAADRSNDSRKQDDRSNVARTEAPASVVADVGNVVVEADLNVVVAAELTQPSSKRKRFDLSSIDV